MGVGRTLGGFLGVLGGCGFCVGLGWMFGGVLGGFWVGVGFLFVEPWWISRWKSGGLVGGIFGFCIEGWVEVE